MTVSPATLRAETIKRIQSRTTASKAAVVVCPVVLLGTHGLRGGVVGSVAVCLWLVSPVAGFALAELGLSLLLGPTASLLELVVTHAGVSSLLLGAGLDEFQFRRAVGVFVVLCGLLAGALVVAATRLPVYWKQTVALFSGFLLASYALHRVGRRRLRRGETER